MAYDFGRQSSRYRYGEAEYCASSSDEYNFYIGTYNDSSTSRRYSSVPHLYHYNPTVPFERNPCIVEAALLVVSSCKEKIQHWEKVESDYEALQKRLLTLPDKLSYEVMVPFGPLAFMPGKLVQTNEITVLLGDNWFAKCSAKEAINLVDHRKKHVRKALDDLQEVVRNFKSRVEFTNDLQRMTDEAGDLFDIREEASAETILTKGKQRLAHKPHSKPKAADSVETASPKSECEEVTMSNEAFWKRMEELEREEEKCGELMNPSEVLRSLSESCSEEEDKENQRRDLNVEQESKNSHTQGKFSDTDHVLNTSHVNSADSHHNAEEEDSENTNTVVTIHFQHTVEPKRVRINTGKNTTLKYSEKKEEAKRKRRNSNGNGHPTPGLPIIKTPADIYRVFVDVVNGEYIPRKSIMKSRSRENSVCSDTSEGSAAELDDRRYYARSCSLEERPCESRLYGVPKDPDREYKKLMFAHAPLEAFSGTVVEKVPFMSAQSTNNCPPALPIIQEGKFEEPSPKGLDENQKRVSKFKAARILQKT
ncbi:unconventional prefoldin RPB5 interactor 1 [Pelodytes ibericus]